MNSRQKREQAKLAEDLMLDAQMIYAGIDQNKMAEAVGRLVKDSKRIREREMENE